MTLDQKKRLLLLAEQLHQLSEELDSDEVSNLFSATRVNGDDSITLSANEEGLVYFASILLSLAEESSPNQHYHFDETSVLSECQKPLVIKFEPAPWSWGQDAKS